MTIRTKLVGAFLLVALLVPLLGGIAVSRVRSIDGDVETLSRDAIPNLLLVKDLDATQREQQRAVLAYVAGGAAQDRQRYHDLVPQVDQRLAELTGVTGRAGRSGAAASAELARQVVDERATFDAAAKQLLDSRLKIEQTTEAVRVMGEEMVLELTVLRNRFIAAPNASGNANPAPLTLRNQINELLLGTEGMLSIVGFEAALATGYTITANEQLKGRFEVASAAFANWLQVAKAAAGPEDRVILDRVETKFYKDFEPDARSLMAAAEQSTAARNQFTAASAGISGLLDRMTEVQAGKLTGARQNAQATAGESGRILVLVTLIGFVAAGTLGLWFAGTITRPLRRLRDVADQISTGNLDNVEIDIAGKDEVADLADAFRRTVVSVRFLMGESAGAGPEATMTTAPAPV